MGMRYGFILDSHFRLMKMVVFKVCYQSFLCLLNIQRSSQFSCQFGIKVPRKRKRNLLHPPSKKLYASNWLPCNILTCFYQRCVLSIATSFWFIIRVMHTFRVLSQKRPVSRNWTVSMAWLWPWTLTFVAWKQFNFCY